MKANNHEKPFLISTIEFELGMKWFGFTPLFGWRSFSDCEMKDIAKSSLAQDRKCPGKHVRLKTGHREVTRQLNTWIYGEQESVLPIIASRFRSAAVEFGEGSCVWFSATILVYLVSKKMGMEMLMWMETTLKLLSG